LSYALAKAARADRSLNDRDLIAALYGDCASYERLLNSGLHYEQPLTSAAAAVCGRGAGGRNGEAVPRGRAETVGILHVARCRRAEGSGVLGSTGATDAARDGPKSRAFIDFLFAQFPEKESAVVGPQEAGSRIIVP
jgi:hypothetical protein